MDRQQAIQTLEQVIAVCNDPDVDSDTIIDNARDRCSEVVHWLRNLKEVKW